MATTVQQTDEFFDVLSHPYRRAILQVLLASGPPLTVTDLAKKIQTNSPSEQTTGAEQLDQLRIKLHHVHLPRMADAGVLTYNPNQNRIPACDLEWTLSEANRDLIHSLLQNSPSVSQDTSHLD